MYGRNQAVITGVGVLAANGIGKEAFWDTLRSGQSGIGPITLFDASRHRSRIAGEVKDFDPTRYVEGQFKPKRMPRNAQLALAATRMALDDANLDGASESGLILPIPVILGVSYSALDVIDRQTSAMHRRGPGGVSPQTVRQSTPQAVAATVSRCLSLPTECTTISTACAAGLDATAEAATLIQSGKANLVIAGGADAPICAWGFACFDSAGLASERNDEPERASRPFDVERDTGVIAEGAGILVLEEARCARARGVDGYIAVTGYASHMDTSPDVPGSGLAFTMARAMQNAGKEPRDIDYLCAHGPGHPVIDRIEVDMIREVFGKNAEAVPVSSIKGSTGNPLAAAGPQQIVASALAIQSGQIPPTANCEHLDPDCDLDIVTGEARRADVNCVLINIHGATGTNSSLVVEKVMAA